MDNSISSSMYNLESRQMQEFFREGNSADYENLFRNRIVHLDMKGAPPKLSYLEEIFPMLSKLGATGILLEYEDMFPFSGDIKHIAANNAYSPSMIEKINSAAEKNNLEIIPLIQTFGHLEFVLKLSEYQHLREVPEQPQALCPSRNKSVSLVHHMLEQVAKLHPKAKRIHIGADEVYFIAKCNTCQMRMSSRQWVSSSDLFLDHVKGVARYVQDKLGLKPMMWDDHFRSISEQVLLESQIGPLVELVVWNYTPVLELRSEVWNKYLNVFDSIWAASSFKGATGSNQILTSIRYHMENHVAWMSLVSQYRNSAHFDKFKGIMMTGWQRYDHFAVLCELLPVSLPSLGANLLLLRYGPNMQRIDEELSSSLQCSDSFFTSFQPPGYAYSIHCRFPGAEVFDVVQQLDNLRTTYHKLLNDSVVRGWITEYNAAHKFSSPTHLERIDVEMSYLKNSVESLNGEVETNFQSVYDRFTIREWLDTYVQPFLSSVDKYCKTIDMLRSKNVWPRRPLET